MRKMKRIMTISFLALRSADVRTRYRAFCRIGCICLLLLGSAGNSLAHVQKTAVTRILFNPNTANIEVMHRLLVHDAEHAATLIFGARQTLLESDESRELFSSYVMNRFAIEASVNGADSTPLKLQYVGSEIDGQFLWVYQEIAGIPNITSMQVINSVLRDIWPDQANLVNIEKDGQIHTLNFIENADVLTVLF